MKFGHSMPSPSDFPTARISAAAGGLGRNALDSPIEWRIAIGYTLKKRAPIILRITQACLLLLIVGSLQPARPGPVLAWHREIHWLAFAGATFLLLLLSRNRRQEIRSAIGAFLLGLSLECLQHFIYRNPMEWWDVRDDSIGTLAAFALYAGSRLPAVRRHSAQFARWILPGGDRRSELPTPRPRLLPVAAAPLIPSPQRNQQRQRVRR
jgi:hypothetical protein